MSYVCSFCQDNFRSQGGLTKHVNSKHNENSTLAGMAKASQLHTFVRHPHLSARPCSSDGAFLGEPVPRQPKSDLSESCGNPWLPFNDRLQYEWAYYHYVRLQSSAEDIRQGLDLWRAMATTTHQMDHDSCDGVPWKSAKEMYNTIDSISVGGVSWVTYQLSYNGPQPTGTLPRWMQETYKLNVRNILSVFEEQLASKEFDGQFEYTPYKEYDAKGHRVYSNLMSGNWAFCEADTISQDKNTEGSMFVPIVAGSDKTTVSVATGGQEYHPVYASLGNITNTTRRGHGNGVTPIAFLPIPKSTKRQRKRPEFQMFCRQLYHSCLELVFMPLKPYMTKPRVMRCPDGHFRRTIFGLGPYIADYPEQVWLAGIVSTWCPKCDAVPTDLDGPGSHQRSHKKTDLLIKTFKPSILWDDFGVWHNIVPFTHSFPRADIHELLAPDLLHQLIKGVFKDHLVEWVLEYLHLTHREKVALETIEDIDRRISAVAPFPGLRRFADGRDFKQWTGDDSKALMKVFLAAIAGYVPSAMVCCVAAFMDACYIARQNSINSLSLERFRDCVETFHELRAIFIEAGVCATLSLPRQHALKHFYHSIHLFGSPNGLCSSITESKHIRAVKEPWRRSSRYQALTQMLTTLQRMDKMLTLRRCLGDSGMLHGLRSTSELGNTVASVPIDNTEELEDEDEAIVPGTSQDMIAYHSLLKLSESGYPSQLHALAAYIKQPMFPLIFAQFLYKFRHPDERIAPSTMEECPVFDGAIKVHHSAVATFYAPSDLSGSGGLRRERIRSTPNFFGHPRHNTVFVVVDSQPGMEGMEIGRVLLFFSFEYRRKNFSCALINWFVHTDERDPDTGMWIVKQELDRRGKPTLEVIHVDSIARAAHLLPIYGGSRVPEDFDYHTALDSYCTYFVNHYVNHHAHEFISRH
ncbi:hypothetical protein EDB89DRAFT_1861472 [Lactarius sanguifluus]|nr:hypothetical protein EDB89DRAFT_1861472 [Lactarius sanguifluus]